MLTALALFISGIALYACYLILRDARLERDAIECAQRHRTDGDEEDD